MGIRVVGVISVLDVMIAQREWRARGGRWGGVERKGSNDETAEQDIYSKKKQANRSRLHFLFRNWCGLD